MYLANLKTSGFRSIDNFEIEFSPGLNVIVGPNNAGKTAILEAISLALSVPYNPAREIFVNAEDFWHSIDGKEREEREFRVVVEVADIHPLSLGLFSQWMIPGSTTPRARISVICSRDLTDPDEVIPKWRVGERGNLKPDEEALKRVRPVFLPPLRDAESNLKPGRRSRLARLIQHMADASTATTIEEQFRQLQDDLIDEPPFSTAAERINERLLLASGAIHRQSARLVFLEPEFRRIAEMLQMRVGVPDMDYFSLAENGLGYNNLLYIATVLSQLSRDSQQELRLLLVEEPEAHLHPQMQQVLVDALLDASKEAQPAGEERTQVIMTTHSPLLAAHVPVENIIVLHRHRVEPDRLAGDTRRPRMGKPLARSIGSFGLEATTLNDLTRYLDSTKANLFFAEGIVLVEGIAEALLFPILAKAIGRNLNDFHTSIVNIDGLAFEPFRLLFSNLNRLQAPCAVVTDSDPTFRVGDKWYKPRNGMALVNYDFDALDEVDGDEVKFPKTLIDYGRAYQLDLRSRTEKSGVRVFRSFKTLEYDLALTELLPHMLVAYALVDGDTEMNDAVALAGSNRQKAITFYKRFNSKLKGQFAQRLAALLEPIVRDHWIDQGQQFGEDKAKWQPFVVLPGYIDAAIRWVTGDCDWSKV